MSAKQDITGLQFGRLLAVQEGPRKGEQLAWHCQCDCGASVHVTSKDLKSGHTRSCGCLAREIHADRLRTHGLYRTPEWVAWRQMISRCTSPKNKEYKYYGARGISVCERWVKSVVSFVEDMGLRSSPKHSIDRIDVNGNYEPGNCRWTTDIVQARNKRAQARSESGVSGVTRTPSGWMARIGTPSGNICLGSYANVEDAISARKNGEATYWR